MTILILTIAAFGLLWFLVLFNGNTTASGLMHYNLFEGTRYFQQQFDMTPNLMSVGFTSGFYWASAWSAKLFGHSFRAFLAPNFVFLILFIIGMFLLGTDLHNKTAGVFCAVVCAASPTVSGLAQAYEGSLGEMACLTWCVLFFFRWTQKYGWQFLVLALAAGLAASVMGTQITMQTLMLMHLATALGVFSAYAVITRVNNGFHSVRDIVLPWIGALVIVLASVSLYYQLTVSHGQFLEYQFGEMQKAHQTEMLPFNEVVVFYLASIVYSFFTLSAMLLLATGILVPAKDNRRRLLLLPACWGIIPIFLLAPVGKFDAAYILPTVPALCLLIGLAGARLFEKKGVWSLAAAVFLLCMTHNAINFSFSSRKVQLPIIQGKTLGSNYEFFKGTVLSDEVYHFDRIAEFLAKTANAEVGVGSSCLPMLLAPDRLLEQFRARIIMARSRTFPLISENIGDYTTERLFHLIDFWVIVLDSETTGKTLSEQFGIYKARTKVPFAANVLDQLMNRQNEFELIERGCGLEIYKLKTKHALIGSSNPAPPNTPH